MSWTFVVVYAHLAGTVIFVGYFLFWALITAATWREFSGESAERLLQAARAAAWPLPGFKLSLSLIGWLLLVVVAGSGMLLIVSGMSVEGAASKEIMQALTVKVILLVALVACMPKLGASRAPLALLSLVLILFIVVVSTQLIR